MLAHLIFLAKPSDIMKECFNLGKREIRFEIAYTLLAFSQH